MFDVVSMQQFLIKNTNILIELLEKADFHHITFNEHKQNIRCAYHIDGNPTAISILTNNLYTVDFVRNIKGNIFTLLQHKLELNFKDTFQWVKNQLKGHDIQPKVLLCGGYYSKFRPDGTISQEKFYDIDDLYDWKPNKMFLNDNISLETQKKFRIGYDIITQRIVIPYETEQGIVGTIGRCNYEPDENEPKYLALDTFTRSNYLYGWLQNHQHILEKQVCFLVESEKGVMQLDTYNLPYGLALGKNVISERQLELLKYLNVPIVLCLDEGISLTHIKNECAKFNKSIFGKIDVYYIYDKDSKYLPKGSKASPTDLGSEIFKKLLKECLHKWEG